MGACRIDHFRHALEQKKEVSGPAVSRQIATIASAIAIATIATTKVNAIALPSASGLVLCVDEMGDQQACEQSRKQLEREDGVKRDECCNERNRVKA